MIKGNAYDKMAWTNTCHNIKKFANKQTCKVEITSWFNQEINQFLMHEFFKILEQNLFIMCKFWFIVGDMDSLDIPSHFQSFCKTSRTCC